MRLKCEAQSQRKSKMKDSLAPEKARYTDRVTAVSLGGFPVNDRSLYPCKNILFLFRPSWSLILASGRILIKILRMVKSQAIESLISSSSKSHPPGWLWGRWVLEGPVASSRREEGNPESKANEEMYRLKAYSLCPRPSRIWNPKPGDSSHSVTPIMAILH